MLCYYLKLKNNIFTILLIIPLKCKFWILYDRLCTLVDSLKQKDTHLFIFNLKKIDISNIPTIKQYILFIFSNVLLNP